MSDPTADATKAASFFSSLEKATEVQTFLLVFTFMLTVDCGLLYSHGYGILALARDGTLLKPQLGVSVIIIFVVFSLLMAVARPIGAPIILQLTLGTVYAAEDLFYNIKQMLSPHRDEASDAITRNYRSNLGSGWVTVPSLQKKAHATKESYYLDILHEADADENSDRDQRNRLAFAAISVLAVSAYNWFKFSGPASPGFLREVAEHLGDGGALAVWLSLIGVFWVFAVLPIKLHEPLRWVYCPSLAKEEASAFDRREDEVRKFRAGVRMTERGHKPKLRVASGFKLVGKPML